MKETIAQFLKVTDFPFFIKNKDNKEIYSENYGYWYKREHDQNGNEIYFENSDGFWNKCEYDQNGKEIYFEDSTGYWNKNEHDQNGKLIYRENSDGYWSKREHDQNSNVIYYENSEGTIIDNRPKVIELTLEQIADKFGLSVENIRIKV